MQNQEPTVQISARAAQVFVALLDEANLGQLISGRDARYLANDLEGQLRELQVKANLEAQEQFRQQVLAEQAEKVEAKSEAEAEANPEKKAIEFPEPEPPAEKPKKDPALIGLEGGKK